MPLRVPRIYILWISKVRIHTCVYTTGRVQAWVVAPYECVKLNGQYASEIIIHIQIWRMNFSLEPIAFLTPCTPHLLFKQLIQLFPIKFTKDVLLHKQRSLKNIWSSWSMRNERIVYSNMTVVSISGLKKYLLTFTREIIVSLRWEFSLWRHKYIDRWENTKPSWK